MRTSEMAATRRLGARLAAVDKLGLFAALCAVCALAFTAQATLGGFTATITNPTNNFATATVQLRQVTGGVTTCYSTGTGAGGSVTASNTNSSCVGDSLGNATLQAPGSAAVSTTVDLTNVGNLDAATSTLVVTPLSCVGTASGDNGGYTGADTAGFCTKINITIDDLSAGTCLFPVSASPCAAPTNTNTLQTLATQTDTTPPLALGALNAGQTRNLEITVQLDASATNAHQGLTTTAAFTWAEQQ